MNKVPSIGIFEYQIIIEDPDDDYFTYMLTNYPDGMETFLGGSVRFIHWLSEITSTTEGRSIKLEYSTDGIDGGWELISEGVPDTGTFQWNVPFENSEDCYIRIT